MLILTFFFYSFPILRDSAVYDVVSLLILSLLLLLLLLLFQPILAQYSISIPLEDLIKILNKKTKGFLTFSEGYRNGALAKLG